MPERHPRTTHAPAGPAAPRRFDVLLLPGLACDEALFEPQIEALRRHAAVASVRVTDLHRRHATLPEMAAALWREHAGPRLLVGASMGGMLALQAWRAAPQRVAGMVILGSSARADTPEQLRLRSQACELFEQGRLDEVLRANVALALHPVSAKRRALVESYFAMVRRAGTRQLVGQNRAVMAREDQRALLPQVRCPVLLACGEADRLTPPELAREMAAALPRARLEILPGAGHLPTLEQPERVNALLAAFIAELAAAA